MVDEVTIAFLVAGGAWLFVLSVFLTLIYKKLRHLMGRGKEGDLIEVLNKILKVEKSNVAEIANIKKELARFDKEGLSHLQKFSLVRFNPFGELGGEHSFALTLLNGEDNGVIITGLHTRERTRLYLKEIKKGKCKLELSREEKKALQNALGRKG